jgi:DNA-binding MltR family transcriptional regulator
MDLNKSEPLNFSSFFGAFRNEPDRAAAVLGAPYVEAALERLFRSRLIVDAPKELFKARGPLSDFAGKIDLAYSLGWIPESLRNDLHIVRRIRNDFAHDPNHTLSFSDPSVRDRINNFSVRSQFEALIEEATSLCTDPSRAATMQEEMREGLLGTPRKRIELVITNAEVFSWQRHSAESAHTSKPREVDHSSLRDD